MAASLKHREISQRLLAEIVAGKFGSTGRLPSEAQLVKRFGVSRPTVARAFRDLEREGLVERRAGSGTYVRGRGASTAPLRQLGLLVPGLGTTEIFGLICGELAALARTNEYALVWGGSPHPGQSEALTTQQAVDVCDQFIERRVAGVFFAPFELNADKGEANLQIAERLRDAGIPVVLLDRDLSPFPARSPFDLVGLDNLAAGYLVAEHLYKLGCRRLAFLARPYSAGTVDGRIAGVREAQVRRGIEAVANWVHLGAPDDPKVLRSLTARGRWDAVVCANDLTAAVLLRLLEKNDVRVPRDLRLVGFDDVKYASLLSVPLTTVHQPCGDIAAVAYRAMTDRIADPTLPPRSLLLTPQLVVRESCGAYLPRPPK